MLLVYIEISRILYSAAFFCPRYWFSRLFSFPPLLCWSTTLVQLGFIPFFVTPIVGSAGFILSFVMPIEGSAKLYSHLYLCAHFCSAALHSLFSEVHWRFSRLYSHLPPLLCSHLLVQLRFIPSFMMSIVGSAKLYSHLCFPTMLFSRALFPHL